MKKLLLFIPAFLLVIISTAQETQKAKKDWSKVKLTGRANDHFMIQYGIANWGQTPDSVAPSGTSRSFNFYVMMDMPFKTDPRFSVAFGPGISTDHYFFKNKNITLTDKRNPLRIQNVADTNHFSKYKLAIAYLELPVELRFCLNPENSNSSFKAALGVKVGLLASAHTKGKGWVDKTNSLVAGYDESFIQKQKGKSFFNSNRIVGTFRVGYGNISIYANYQLGSLIKEGLGPTAKPYSLGLTISGL